MKCMYCQGDLIRGVAPFHIDRAGTHITIDAVAAWVCSQCGEPMFEEKTVVAVQRIIQAVDEESANLAAAAPNPPPH